MVATALGHQVTFNIHMEIDERIIPISTMNNSTMTQGVCHKITSANSGSFRVRFSPNEERDNNEGRPALRIRLVGPQIKLVPTI
jgi:hypothetical protein